jgi:hypothetical protein
VQDAALVAVLQPREQLLHVALDLQPNMHWQPSREEVSNVLVC